ncbi:PH domain-containing protein [Peribacillus sp. SCS-26]|uniref:PH domain-containing protein n=1 Tax=Paraperibacillus marinus TaxID=3115295 RepID=UPI00390637A7
MVFKVKKDSFFIFFLASAFLLVASVFLVPLFLDLERTILDTAVILTLLLVSAGFLLWCGLGVTYVMERDHLYLRGGPFRNRIPYEDITKVKKTSDIFTGYRLLSSRDGLEIFYKTASLGSVKISPADGERFKAELKKRCPGAAI